MIDENSGALPGADVYSYSFHAFSVHKGSLRGDKKKLSFHGLSLTSEQHRQLPYGRVTMWHLRLTNVAMVMPFYLVFLLLAWMQQSAV